MVPSDSARPVDAPGERGKGLLRALAGTRWVPLVFVLAGLSITAFFWQVLVGRERNQLAIVAEVQARSTAGELERGFQGVTQSLITLAQRYGKGFRDGGAWEVMITGLQATAWAESSGVIRRVVADGTHDLAGADLSAREADRAALLKARESGRPAVTRSIGLPDGAPGFHLIVPISDGSRPGFLVGVFSERTVERGVLDRDRASGWALAVYEGDQEVYRRGSPRGGRWLADSTFKIVDVERRLRVSPDPEVVARLNSPLPALVLATGSIISLLLAASVGLAQAAWRRAREAQAVQGALRDSEARFRNIVTTAQEGVWTLDADGRTTYVNPRMADMLGLVSEEMLGRPLDDFMEEGQANGRHVERFLEGTEESHDVRFRRKDGADLWTSIAMSRLYEPDGRVAGALAMVTDITERKDAELKLAESEAQYRLLFDGNPHPMWVYEGETRAFLAVNDAAIRHYGYSRAEFLAMTIRDIRPPEEVGILDEFAERRRREQDLNPFQSPRVWKHRKKDGALIDVEIAGSPSQFQGRQAWLVLASDVTDKKRLEVQLLQSQKMESVGRLAGGVAHDFNNLLGVITGYGELLRRDIGPEHPGFSRVEQIRKAADRAAALTRQLLAFSRKQLLEPKVLDLNAVVSDVEQMLGRLIGEDIQLITAFGANLRRVSADRGQLEQVIVNLAVNARDAMPKGGKLIIETGNVDLDEAYAASRPDAHPGPHVMLAVSDTGHGMSAETLAHMFEPFFTTKEQGKGTGLGLATTYGIVRQSGGHVMVYSELGQGTTFKVYLPQIVGEEEVAAGRPVAGEAPSGMETILLVEDDSSLRVMISEILQTAGYKVLEGPTPEEALAAAGAHVGPLLVLTDVVLPRMSGRQMADALRSSRPESRVLFMSGYTDDAIGHHGILEAGVHFLQKPFTTDSLLRKVREVLDAPSGLPGAPR